MSNANSGGGGGGFQSMTLYEFHPDVEISYDDTSNLFYWIMSYGMILLALIASGIIKRDN